MIKKTFYFGSPVYLSLKNAQLVIKLPEVIKNGALSEGFKQISEVTKPIEDIGIVVLDNKQITITSGVLEALLEKNCAVITCDSKSMPVGLMLPLYGNTTQNERFRQQIGASLPLMKQLWQQTVKAKIENQAAVLNKCVGEEIKCMKIWATDVKSGDPDNLEARAAAYYWKKLFKIEGFTRDRAIITPYPIRHLSLTGFVAKVGFYACPTRPLLHVAAFEGGVEGIVMVVVMHAQCRHEAVQRAHGIQPLFRRAFLRMAQYINGAGQMRLRLLQGGHILDGKQIEKFFIGRTDDALQGGSL